jgi:hypothetical protein
MGREDGEVGAVLYGVGLTSLSVYLKKYHSPSEPGDHQGPS